MKLSGNNFINPFCIGRFDETLIDGLETWQMSEEQIQPNRNRFYPEIDWSDLNQDKSLLKMQQLKCF